MADHENDNLFQVSVKGLFFNEENKVMLMREIDGAWEAPGGRIQKGENLIEALKRECLEETGLKCEILDKRPLITYPALDRTGRPRIMIYFKIKFENLNFKPTDECLEIKFFSKEEMRGLAMVSQTNLLPDYL